MAWVTVFWIPKHIEVLYGVSFSKATICTVTDRVADIGFIHFIWLPIKKRILYIFFDKLCYIPEMENFFAECLKHTISFFAIIDPIGVSAVMLSLLGENINKQTISMVSRRVSITIVIAFFVVLISGNFILNLFHIDTNSIKVIGGIVLVLTALAMIQSDQDSMNQKLTNGKRNLELAIIPIAIPITFGPGIFSAIIIVRDQVQNMGQLLAIVAAFLVNALIVYIVFKNSIHIKSYLGETGQSIITKLMGLIVGAIAVQFIISGSVALVKSYL
ncbi:MarC family protein [Sulfurovum mangrovi]|uniref:MarC family protein n=1 Tax=Sulfurovum mangrovi TaxID=2893889 RepID=UPI001E2D43BD|nr:MarC family protein [Sulfurovum mangrovi]UFH58154.1 MarC family protein [Sulfurovum mangrovi]